MGLTHGGELFQGAAAEAVSIRRTAVAMHSTEVTERE